MKMYQLPYSHYSAKARLVVLEKKLKVDLPDIPGGAPSSEEYLRINPTGLVPCLIDGDFTLGESEVIAEYLEDKHPENPMLPADAQLRARSRWLSRMHDLSIAPILTELYVLSLSESPDTEHVQQALESLHQQLALIESTVNPQPFFFKEQFGIADASYVLSFWFATILCSNFDSPVTSETYPKLTNWFEAACARDSVSRVLEDCKRSLGMLDENDRKSA